MHPILIEIGPLTIRTYGFLLAVGVLSAILLVYRLAKKGSIIDADTLSSFLFYTILVGLLGAKIFLLFTDFKEYIQNPGELKYLLTSAGTFYGGLICGTLFAAWYIRKKRLDFKVLGDIVAPGIALAHFFGRMGCFFAGCCWGRIAEGCSIAVYFPRNDAATGVPTGIPLYPTQLIEAALNLLNFIFLFIFYKKRKFPGQVFAVYIFNYSLIRLFVEFFRGDGDRGYIFGDMHEPFTSLSVPQLFSLIGIGAAIILYRVFKKTSKTKGARQQAARK